MLVGAGQSRPYIVTHKKPLTSRIENGSRDVKSSGDRRARNEVDDGWKAKSGQ